MQGDDFLPVEEHFDRLVANLPERVAQAYSVCNHVRVETAYRNRHFLVYKIVNDQPVPIDRVIVRDFTATDNDGARCRVDAVRLKKHVMVGYTPTKLWDWPIFLWLPLHSKIRWGASEETAHGGSLGFPLVVRTMGRKSLREPDVTYFETGRSFGKEFAQEIADAPL